MEQHEHGFFAYLFMTISGIALIIIGILPIIISINSAIEKAYKEKNEKLVEVTVISKEVDESGIWNSYKVTYVVTYTINNKEYVKELGLDKISYANKGDKVTLAYTNNPEKLMIPYTEGAAIIALAYLPVTLPFFIIGVLCIKRYNVFKYKKTINVE